MSVKAVQEAPHHVSLQHLLSADYQLNEFPTVLSSLRLLTKQQL